jgi:hypothetical protein
VCFDFFDQCDSDLVEKRFRSFEMCREFCRARLCEVSNPPSNVRVGCATLDVAFEHVQFFTGSYSRLYRQV